MAKTIDIDVAALDECLTKLRDVLAELEGYVPMCDEASGSGKVVSQLAEIDSALDEVKSNLSTLITTSISFFENARSGYSDADQSASSAIVGE